MAVLTGFVVVMHVIFALMMIMFVLLHRGSGGGLADVFGGGAAGGMQGSAMVEKNLDRMTVATAILFGVTNVALVQLL